MNLKLRIADIYRFFLPVKVPKDNVLGNATSDAIFIWYMFFLYKHIKIQKLDADMLEATKCIG